MIKLKKIVGIVSTLGMLSVISSGCHRPTVAYQDYTRTESELAVTEDSEAVLAEESVDTQPEFQIDASGMCDYFEKRNYKISSYEEADSDNVCYYQITNLEENVTIEVSEYETHGLRSVAVLVYAESLTEFLNDPLLVEEYIRFTRDIFECQGISFDETEVRAFVEDTEELNGMSVLFGDKVSMYSQFYNHNYIVYMTPVVE